MNKFAKGSLAAGAGLVLLLGGAGTLAYWNTDIELTGGGVSAGTLELTADTEQLIKAGPVTLAPGDEQTFSAELNLLAEGEGIQGTVALDETSILYYNAEGVETPDLAEKYDVEITLAEEPEGGLSASGDTLVFTQPGEYTIDVEVTIALPYGDSVDNSTQGSSVNFEKVSFVATQTPVEN
ncbi:alternate-type signal peptide domain-containing protein [Brachybacterium epidermidis]|uniref:alternate-type signal peptide domain-containing protein n=1 Tax=Brachybacterium epidermidis TaxID=2781983 RepID=UPI00398EF753